MTTTGNWTLHFSWGCTGSYNQSAVVFDGNGTFGGQLTGKWRQRDGTRLLGFDTGPAKYGGTVIGNVGTGLMSTFTGLDGCWYLTKEGTSGVVPEAAAGSEAGQPAGADGSAPGGAR